eukprot:1161687-Pelagomonas_calceolata.AAC.4
MLFSGARGCHVVWGAIRRCPHRDDTDKSLDHALAKSWWHPTCSRCLVTSTGVMMASLNAVAMAPEAPEMNELCPACVDGWPCAHSFTPLGADILLA